MWGRENWYREARAVIRLLNRLEGSYAATMVDESYWCAQLLKLARD